MFRIQMVNLIAPFVDVDLIPKMSIRTSNGIFVLYASLPGEKTHYLTTTRLILSLVVSSECTEKSG